MLFLDKIELCNCENVVCFFSPVRKQIYKQTNE